MDFSFFGGDDEEPDAAFTETRMHTPLTKTTTAMPMEMPDDSSDSEEEQAMAPVAEAVPVEVDRVPRGSLHVESNVRVTSDVLQISMDRNLLVFVPKPEHPAAALFDEPNFSKAYEMARRRLPEPRPGEAVIGHIEDLEQRLRRSWNMRSAEMSAEAVLNQAGRASSVDAGIKAMGEIIDDGREVNSTRAVTTRLVMMIQADMLRSKLADGRVATMEDVNLLLDTIPRSVQNRTYRAIATEYMKTVVMHGPRTRRLTAKLDEVSPTTAAPWLFEPAPGDPLQRPCKNGANGTCAGMEAGAIPVIPSNVGNRNTGGCVVREFFPPTQWKEVLQSGSLPRRVRECLRCNRRDYTAFYYTCAATCTNPAITSDHRVKVREGGEEGYPPSWCIGALPDHTVVVNERNGYPAHMTLPFMANNTVAGFSVAALRYMPATYVPARKTVTTPTGQHEIRGFMETLPGFQ